MRGMTRHGARRRARAPPPGRLGRAGVPCPAVAHRGRPAAPRGLRHLCHRGAPQRRHDGVRRDRHRRPGRPRARGPELPAGRDVPRRGARRGGRRLHLRALGVDDRRRRGSASSRTSSSPTARSPRSPARGTRRTCSWPGCRTPRVGCAPSSTSTSPTRAADPPHDDLVALGDGPRRRPAGGHHHHRARGVRRRDPARDRRPGGRPLGGEPARPRRAAARGQRGAAPVLPGRRCSPSTSSVRPW